MDVNIPGTSLPDLEWKKIERDMRKVGLKNGLSDGRDLNFQRSFDSGYMDGFRNAFILGNLKFQSEQKKELETLELLDQAKSGMCVVCTNEKDNENVADVREKQEKSVRLNIKQISLHLGISEITT